MTSRIQRIIRSLELEERILIAAVVFTAVSVFFPWISGEWLGGSAEDYSGFSFFQSPIGWAIFLLQVVILGMTIQHIVKPMHIKRSTLYGIRLILTAQSVVLILVALSVLTRVTFESTRMNVRYGVYAAFIGSLIATFYAVLKFQQVRKSGATNHFHHPEDMEVTQHKPQGDVPPPPPPIQPSEPEEHRIRP